MRDFGFRRYMQRGFEVFAYLHHFDGATIADLCDQTGMSLPTVKRLIRFLREELRERIIWNAAGAGGGRYRLHDWGYLDETRVLADFRPVSGGRHPKP